jgi:predicted membrane protein
MAIYTALLMLKSPIVAVDFPIIIILITIVSTLSHLFLLKTASTSFLKFTNAFMITTTVKLLLYLSVMAAYVFIDKDLAKIFILNFTVLYFIYTPFEVYMILKQAKRIDHDKKVNTQKS